MRKILVKPYLCLLLACFGPATAHAQISDSDTVNVLEAFFAALSVENYGNGDLEALVTDDFIIFEMGQRFTLPEFKAFLASASYSTWKSTRWSISNYTVTSSAATAHIFYQNDGVFVFPNENDPTQLTKQENMWLESALVVEKDGTLKLKFLQSENVSRVESKVDAVD